MRSPLLLLLLCPFLLAEQPELVRGARRPCPTPDGSRLLFAWQGDLWSAELATGHARRLTLHPGHDDYPVVSPDGAWLVFASDRDGGPDLYKQPLGGGPVERLTWHEAADRPCAVSSGGLVLFASRRGRDNNLYTVPLSGGTPRQVTVTGGDFGVFGADGRSVIFGRGHVSANTHAFEGSGNYDLFVTELGATQPPRRLTWSLGHDTWPVVDSAGRMFWSAGHELLSRAEDEAAARVELELDQPIRSVSLRGGEFFLEAGFDIVRWRPGAEPAVVALRNMSDAKLVPQITHAAPGSPEEPDVGPDGSLVFSQAGSLWIAPPGGGEARALTRGSDHHWPRFLAGGDSVVFQSAEAGNSDLYIVATRGGTPRQLTTAPEADFYHCPQGYGMTVVFCSERSGNRDVWALNLRDGRLRQLTNNPAIEDDPSLSPDGRLLAFDSDVNGERDIWIADLRSGQSRCVAKTETTDQCPVFSPDGTRLAFERREGSGAAVYVHALDTRTTQRIADDASLPRWTADGEHLVYESTAEGGGLATVRVPERIVEPRAIPVTARRTTDLAEFNRTVLDEVYDTIAEQFYDADTHGVDWEATRGRYAPLVERAETGHERALWLNRMLGELNASHMGVRPGAARATASGELGVRLRPAGNHLEVVAVLENGPAARAGVLTGDRLLGIDGEALHPHTNLYALLADKARREIELALERDGSVQTLTVRTTRASSVRSLEYQAWLRGRQREVERLAGERLGYVHLSAMNQSNLERFRRAVDSFDGREGLVIDVRGNGGGNIHEALLRILMLRPYGTSHTRGRAPQERFDTVWERPFVVLIDERSFSDAEIFGHCVQSLGLGAVVGMPTSGSVIGTTSRTLLDGSSMRVPRTGWFGLDGENLEGLGVTPDIIVPLSEEDRYFGRDPQLDRAVRHLLESIETAPERPPLRPRDGGAGAGPDNF